MVVSTQTEQVRDLRRGVMELYLSDHPTDCPGCARGNCEMQGLARQVGVAEVRYGLDGANHLADTVDASNPYFAYDPKACIVCSRCVRACSEVQGTFALTAEGRGHVDGHPLLDGVGARHDIANSLVQIGNLRLGEEAHLAQIDAQHRRTGRAPGQ